MIPNHFLRHCTRARNLFVAWCAALLLSASLIATPVSAGMPGTEFMTLCLKQSDGRFPDACLAYVEGLWDGLQEGARIGARNALADTVAVRETARDNPGIYLGFCDRGPIDIEALTEALYAHLAADRSLLPQPMALTLHAILLQQSPLTDCTEVTESD